MKSDKDFFDFFENELKPDLIPLEESRLRILSARKVIAVVVVLLFIIQAFICQFYKIPFWSFFISVPLLTFLAVRYYKSAYSLDDISEEFKQTVVHPLIQFACEGFTYMPKGSVSYEKFEKSGLFLRKPDHFSGDDFFFGNIDDTAIQFSEVIAQFEEKRYISEDKEDSVWHTIFHGIFMVALLKKSFPGHTLILSAEHQKHFPDLGAKMQEFNFNRPQFIDHPHEEFKKEFAVYAQEPEKALKVLEPHIIKTLLKFKKESGLDIYVSFNGNYVYIATNYGRNLFEIDMDRSILDPSTVKTYFDDLNFGMKLISELSFDKSKIQDKGFKFPPEFFL